MQVLLMTPESTPVSGDAGLVTRQRNAIDAFFIDANDGLWIDGSGPKIVRIQLPQESQPAR